MASDTDLWYIRLPDGRILRARSTDALRRFLKTGKIPWESRVRQSADAPWQTLDRETAFADLVPESNLPDLPTQAGDSEPTPKARAAALDLRPLGMRGLVEELFNAFDSCLQHTKLTATAFTGLGAGVTVFLGDVAIHQLLHPDWAWAGYAVTAFILLVLFSFCTSIVTQMTALELSRFRPAHFNEIRTQVFSGTIRLIGALGLVGGALAGLMVCLRLLPTWIAPDNAATGLWQETLLNVANGTRFVAETICWPIFGFAMLLMGPILLVEEFSITRGVREWLAMLKQHLGRIYLYQTIAFAFATMMTLPLLLPVLLAFGFAGGNPRTLSLGESLTFYLLVGVSLTPMLAYLLVAHVFVYLNLRYEFFYSARERGA